MCEEPIEISLTVFSSSHFASAFSKLAPQNGQSYSFGTTVFFFRFYFSCAGVVFTSSYFIITCWGSQKCAVPFGSHAYSSHIHAAIFARKWKRHQPESTTAPCVSLQHVDVAALLIKYNACVNATDKWAFTPLHEAAQKGRTQLCTLLLAHGADPTLRNQEGQSPLDLVTVFTLCVCLLDKPHWGKKIFLLVAIRQSTILFIFCTSDMVKPSQAKLLLIRPGRIISLLIMS